MKLLWNDPTVQGKSLERKPDYIKEMNKLRLDLGELARKHVYTVIVVVARHRWRMGDQSAAAAPAAPAVPPAAAPRPPPAAHINQLISLSLFRCCAHFRGLPAKRWIVSVIGFIV